MFDGPTAARLEAELFQTITLKQPRGSNKEGELEVTIPACDPVRGSGVPPARGSGLGRGPASELAGYFQ